MSQTTTAKSFRNAITHKAGIDVEQAPDKGAPPGIFQHERK
ncbi:hypothetical protein [Pantoea sp. 18069]|nr:hypothetical protein [Pantoea sp. 18069]